MAKDDDKGKKRLVEGPGLLGNMVHKAIDKSRVAAQDQQAAAAHAYATSPEGSKKQGQDSLNRWVKKVTTDWEAYAHRNDLQPTQEALKEFLGHVYPWVGDPGDVSIPRTAPQAAPANPQAANDIKTTNAPRANNRNLQGDGVDMDAARRNSSNLSAVPSSAPANAAPTATAAPAPAPQPEPAPAPAPETTQEAPPAASQPAPAPAPVQTAPAAQQAPTAQQPPAPTEVPANAQPDPAPTKTVPADSRTSKQKYDDAIAKLNKGDVTTPEEDQHISDHIQANESVIDEDKIGKIRYADDLATSVGKKSYKDMSLIDTVRDLGLYDDKPKKVVKTKGKENLKEAPQLATAGATPPNGPQTPPNPGVKNTYGYAKPAPHDPNGPLTPNDLKHFFLGIARRICNNSPARFEAAKLYDIDSPQYKTALKTIGGGGAANKQVGRDNSSIPTQPTQQNTNAAETKMRNIFAGIDAKEVQNVINYAVGGDPSAKLDVYNSQAVQVISALLQYSGLMQKKANK